MSQENVEIVRRTVEAFNRRDLDEALRLWSPDGVWDWSNSHGLDAGVFHGHSEIREFWNGFVETFDELRFELVEAVEIRDGLVLVENVGHVRGRDGIEAQARSAWLIKVADGVSVSLTLFQTKQDALEAAGLSE